MFFILLLVVCLEQVNERLYRKECHNSNKYIFVHHVDPAAPFDFACRIVIVDISSPFLTGRCLQNLQLGIADRLAAVPVISVLFTNRHVVRHLDNGFFPLYNKATFEDHAQACAHK